MCSIPRLALLLSLLAAVLPSAASAQPEHGSVSPYRWSVLRGLAQSAGSIVVGRATRVVPGRRGGLVGGRMVATTDTAITVAVDRVVAGAPALAGTTIQVLVTAADDPGLTTPSGPLLLFLAAEASAHRLCFAETYGLFELLGTRVQIWLEGTPHDERPELDAIAPRLRRFHEERVRVDREASLSGSVLVVRYRLTNDGPRRVRVVPPSWVFDAIWANEVRPGTDERVGPDWAGIRHWEHLRSREALRSLAPGRSTTFTYRVPLAALEMDRPGEYVVGLRYEPFRPSSWAAVGGDGELPDDVFLGVPAELSVRVAVPRP